MCESHSKLMGRSREHCSDVRIVAAPSDHSGNAINSEDRTEIREIVCTKPVCASSEAARSDVDVKIGLAMPDPPARVPVRDSTYGNSAKAMVDEAIWNMRAGNYQLYKTALDQGRSDTEAAQVAGGQLAVIYRKISDYTLQLQAVLSESRAIINVGEAIDKPIEGALLEIISNDGMSDLQKDAAIQQLGTLQEWVKTGLREDITPVQANRIIMAIGNRLNWGGTTNISDELRAVYRALYDSLKTAICTAAPEAQNLHDRLTNLYAAKSDLKIC